jgi:hypothetical protein
MTIPLIGNRAPVAARLLAAALLCVAGALACSGEKTRPVTDAGIPLEDAGPLAGDAGSQPDATISTDAGEPEDSGSDAGLPVEDAGADAGLDAGFDAGLQCPHPPETYACDPADASTCPGGICIVSWCVGQVVDAGWYATCGNGVCDPCETPATCPADCAPPPVLTGQKVYDDPKTISVWVHGFSNHSQSELAMTTYGAVTGCNDLGGALATYEPSVPCATSSPANDTAPNQAVGVDYYGAIPASWMSAQDVMEVEQYPYLDGPTGLQRYGLIVAKFIKWRLAYAGADYVNIACHSMGCLITRYLIENDLEQLASTQKIVRWETNAGVISGAQLSRLYDNPSVQMYAMAIGLGTTSDFALMNPAYVQQYAAAWDHQLWEGNNPLFGGILIHHVGATNPAVPQAAGLPLLDSIPTENPQGNPNDGIMFTFDEFFHSQSPAASVQTPSGMVVPATHSYEYIGHIDEPSSETAHMLMAAGLYHRRKVLVTLQSITLNRDFELHPTDASTYTMTGSPPGEVVAETNVDYNSYTLPTFGTSATIHTDTIAYRSADMFQQIQATTLMPNQIIFEAPVFDGQTDFDLSATLTETDYYLRYGLQENMLAPLLSTDQPIISYTGMNEPLTNHTIPVTNTAATIQLQVQVVDMY